MTTAEIYQGGIAALTENLPTAEIMQLGLSALAENEASAEVEQLGASALTVNKASAEVEQLGMIAFVSYYPDYRIYQDGLEALTVNESAADVEQLGIIALTRNNSQAQIYGAGMMAFVSYVAPPTPAPVQAPPRKPGTPVDIQVAYDPDTHELDVVFNGTDFALDETPGSVLLLSLLTDRRAHPDDTWPVAVPDWANPSSFTARRGAVTDSLDPMGYLAGSRMWELHRRLMDAQTPNDAQDYIVESVQPLETLRGYALQVEVKEVTQTILGYRVRCGSTTVQITTPMQNFGGLN